jgi:DNA-binding protein
MIFDTLPGKYKVFFAGLPNEMTLPQIHTALKAYGKIEKISLKVRSRKPDQNLGYGVVSTNCPQMHRTLTSFDCLHLENCRLEFRNYTIHSSIKVLMDSGKDALYLKGFSREKSIKQIEEEMLETFGEEMIKMVDDYDFTPDTLADKCKIVRVEFQSEEIRKNMQSEFPFTIEDQEICFMS